MSATEQTTFSPVTIEALRSVFSGAVLLPGDNGFDSARAVWNGMADRTPSLIVQPVTTSDVVTAVNFAHDQNLPIAVRGGGHSAAGLGVSIGGLTIDLRRMRQVDVDPDRQTARAQGGATWAEFDAATHAHGLATTGGVISTTGVGGLTLGGGIGNLMRSYGLASDNLLSAEVVTADGMVITASATEHPDLFWALRGGGGNFGVVTSFEFQLHQVDQVFGGMLLFPAERAADLLRVYREVTKTAPNALATYAALLSAPDGTPVCGLVICYNGPADEGEAAIKAFRDFGPPIVDTVGAMPYPALQTMLDEGFPSGLPVWWRAHFLKQLSDEGIAALVDHHAKRPSPLSVLLLEHLGGAVARIARDETAFDNRQSEYNLAIIGRWTEPGQADPTIAWTRAVTAAIQADTDGVYVNYLGLGEQTDRIRAAYGEEKYARLVTVKNHYDPANRFCFNQNIKPTT
jgi:FAD/FMN-containing dehydrogenase